MAGFLYPKLNKGLEYRRMLKITHIKILISIVLALMLTPVSTFAQSEATGPYHLGPGDSVSIQVFGEGDLSRNVKLGEDGRINYAFVGQVELAGQTIAEVEKTITDKLLGDYLINPQVSVTMAEYRPFFINGEVRSPGSFAYQPGLTISRAISLAGGLTERASDRKIFLIRDGQGEADRFRVDLDQEVRPGDTISIEQSFF
jgi:protein involved in polysaccharide export with SLBB domain